MKINKFLCIPFFLLLIMVFFRFLFSFVPIGGGDYTPTSSVVAVLNGNIWGWCGYRDLGFNCTAINLHYNFFWIAIRYTSEFFHLSQAVSERVFWWFPFFLLSFTSVALITKKIFPHVRFWLFAPLLYIFNTYTFMILGGGQISGIGLGYAFAPLVLYLWMYLLEKTTYFFSLSFGSSVAILIALDPRVGFIACIMCLLYGCMYMLYEKKYRLFKRGAIRGLVFILLLPLVTITLLHFYWVLPTLLYRQNPLHDLGAAYDTVAAVKFFSFATFENALGLLHPNWPENIFGLVHFMRPEFLILPIFIFGALFFIKKENNRSFFIIYFLLLSLVGVFLAKGANDPFGNVYLWMFEKIPGFSLFRDSTKWYLCIALGYSVILPFVIDNIYMWVGSKKSLKNLHIGKLVVASSIAYLLFLISPALKGSLHGTFSSHDVPDEYTKLQLFMDKDTSFFRTFWIPVSSRYGQFDLYHPTIDAENFLSASSSAILSDFNNNEFKNILQEASVHYVIVPDDVDHEIFITNRKYDERIYSQTVAALEMVKWLKRDQGFGGIAVFSLRDFKPHAWLSGEGSLSYTSNNPTEYIVNVDKVEKGEKLVFSEGYSRYWVAEPQIQDSSGRSGNIVPSRGFKSQEIESEPYDSLFNSFTLPQNGDYTIRVEYTPQKWVNIGLWVSEITLISILSYYIWKVFGYFVSLEKKW